jgi:NTE family protein
VRNAVRVILSIGVPTGTDGRAILSNDDTAPQTRAAAGSLALVLSGGGARAAYQVGVLAALTEEFRDLDFPILTGVSAGAINTLFLAAHRGPLAAAVARLREHCAWWWEASAESEYRRRTS